MNNLIRIHEEVEMSAVLALQSVLDRLVGALPSVLPCTFESRTNLNEAIFALNGTTESKLVVTLASNGRDIHFHVIQRGTTRSLILNLRIVDHTSGISSVSLTLNGIVGTDVFRLSATGVDSNSNMTRSAVLTDISVDTPAIPAGTYWLLYSSSGNVHQLDSTPFSLPSQALTSGMSIFKMPAMLMIGMKECGAARNSIIVSNIANCNLEVVLIDGVQYVVVNSAGTASYGCSLLVKL